MKVVHFKFNGDTSVQDMPEPQPASDEVVVRVKYSALDTAHQACLNKEMMGYFCHKLQEPSSLGYHYSGTVKCVGSNVTDLKEGAEVFGFLQYEPSQRQGSLSEYIIIKREDCAVKPTGVSFAVAAASTTEAITALQGLRDLGGLEKGQRVLINGAAGGVGSAAVQIAKLLGASHVTAVCSPQDKDQVSKWGADTVIDRKADPNFVPTLLQQPNQKFDVIFDTPNMLPASTTNLLTPTGTIVNTVPTLTFVWEKLKLLFSRKSVQFVECHAKEADLELVGQWLKDKSLDVPLDSEFPIRDIKGATAKQTGRKKGRVVVKVEGGW